MFGLDDLIARATSGHSPCVVVGPAVVLGLRHATDPDHLVAGIGNVFLGDDGFGCAVVRWLEDLQLPGGVDVADYGSAYHVLRELVAGGAGLD